jgi:hypothetical protein
MEEIKYQTTKEECEAKINKDYVCERCGRKIIAMETVDNSGNPTFWAGCWHTDNPIKDSWGNFTGGVPKHIYELAEKLVCEEGKYYSHTDTSDYENKTINEREYIFQEQQAGWAGLLRTIEHLKNNPARKSKKEVLEGKYF